MEVASRCCSIEKQWRLGMKHATSEMTVMFCRLKVVDLELQIVSKPFDAIAADESTAASSGWELKLAQPRVVVSRLRQSLAAQNKCLRSII
jgi:hypothetical protein